MEFDEWWATQIEPHTGMHPNDVLREIYNTAKMAWAAAQPKWQPIETAPDDGRVMLGKCTPGGRAYEMYRGPFGQWLDAKDRIRDPSHWMSMPAT